MANHCANYVTYTCSDLKILKEIRKLFRELTKGLSYKSLSLYEALVSTEQNDDFGTRWIDCQDISEITDNTITITATSCWTPFLELNSKLSKLYNTLTIDHEYSEPGANFGGKTIFSNSVCQMEDSLSYLDYLEKYDKDSFEAELQYLLECEDSNLLNIMVADEIMHADNVAYTILYDGALIQSFERYCYYFKNIFTKLDECINDEYLDKFNQQVIKRILLYLYKQDKLSKLNAKSYYKSLKAKDPETIFLIYSLINIKIDELQLTIA